MPVIKREMLENIQGDTLDSRLVSAVCKTLRELREAGMLTGKKISPVKIAADCLEEAQRIRNTELLIAEAAVKIAMNALKSR